MSGILFGGLFACFDRVSLCRLGYPGTQIVDHIGLRLTSARIKGLHHHTQFRTSLMAMT